MLRTSTTHKYLSSLTQAAAPGVHPPAHPAPPGSLGWGGPSCRDGASHARMQDSVAQPGRRAPQPAGAPSPMQGSPPAPGGHRGLPPWGNSWDGGSREPWSSQGPSLAPPHTPPLCREVSACRSGTRQGREGTPTWGPQRHPSILPCQHPPQHTAPPAVGASSRPQPPPGAAQPRCLD